MKLHHDKKKLEIFGFLSIILLLGITVQSASATIDLNSVDLICDGDTELSFTATIDFLVMCPLFGASPPIITLTGNPVVELLIGFPYVDDGATANDNGDGDLTGSIVTTGLPLDTTTLDTFFITFDVTDSAGNDASQIVRTVTTTKREPTANISITPTTEQLGGVKEVPSLSDIPPISVVPTEPIEEPPTRTLNEIFDLFSLLFDERVLPTAERIIEEVEPLVEPLIPTLEPAPTPEPIPSISVVPTEPIEEPPTRTLDEIFDLFSFLFEEVEPIPTLEVVPESVTEIPPPLSQPSTPTEVRPSFIESIQNFFTRLFG